MWRACVVTALSDGCDWWRITKPTPNAPAIRKEAAMISSVKKRSIVIRNHKTSISLEDIFWACLRQIAHERATTVSKLIGILDAERNGGNLSSTIRVFVLNRYCNNVAANQTLDAEAGRNSPVIDISLADAVAAATRAPYMIR
jgi:predicted DNA-binding ribbon-helix-helix protein